MSNNENKDCDEQNNGLVKITFVLDRGPLSPGEQEKFIADLARLVDASPEEFRIIRQHEDSGGEIGDEMADGTIYAGISPRTGRKMYVTPQDEPSVRPAFSGAVECAAQDKASLLHAFAEAVEYTANLDAHGHRDFRIPSIPELKVIWGNRLKGNLAGTFKDDSGPDALYWSCEMTSRYAYALDFFDGAENELSQRKTIHLRCIRG